MPAWSRAAVVVALVALLLTTGPATALVTPAPSATAPETAATTATQASQPFESNTTYQIDMRAGGNATWTLTVSFRFDNDSHREGFEAVADDFSDGQFLREGVFEQANAKISEETGRRMRIANVSRRVETTSDRGRLIFSFTWTNFGYERGGQLYVDDVFRTDTRLFTELDERETLIITRPDGYQFVSASTNIQNRTLRWEGPHSFQSGTLPAVVFDRIDPPTTTTNTTTPAANPNDDAGETVLFVLAGIVLIGALATVAYVARRRDETLFPTADGGTGAADRETPDPGPTPPDAEAPVESGDGPEQTEHSDEPDEEEPIDEELLSDEERVERLLASNGGRMKQANIVQETGWSNAKVSQLLSSMDEADRIEKLRIGRENLISFPDEEDDAA